MATGHIYQMQDLSMTNKVRRPILFSFSGLLTQNNYKDQQCEEIHWVCFMLF